ncbi:neutral zinc metallopeptidase [Kribbella sp. CA-293567]|uniref:neutral zinc metallopeptidase n=1 Tax=Kribbella sp. CA-293567 TaxID=3002436 RepID=UPI0022DDA228|nr:neutral zinc metallopeptidase [Kribbella sp. CA-293567]WBQ04547.1 neutral zinc metallopeptidase [Kribbella sp. CA-293567]
MGWGAPQPGGPGWTPPRKKGGAGKAILLVLGVVVLGVVGGTAAVIALKPNDPYTSTPSPTATYSPTYSPSEEPSPQPPSTQPTSPVAPTTSRPTATRPTAPRTTSRPTTKPRSEPSNLDIVARNRLYQAGKMGSVNCRESSARPATAAGARANYANLVNCLNRSWPALVQRSGSTFRAPRVMSFSGTVTTPCGSMYDSGPPFYCPSNQTIYMNLTEDVGNYKRVNASYARVWARMWMLHQFAHEYGHHVQNLTGIMRASFDLRYDAPNQAGELLASRRLELQASCLGDVFIAANKRSYPLTGESLRQWNWLIGNTVDPKRDHGSKANHKYWALRGFNAVGPGACNTFTASQPRVS